MLITKTALICLQSSSELTFFFFKHSGMSFTFTKIIITSPARYVRRYKKKLEKPGAEMLCKHPLQ